VENYMVFAKELRRKVIKIKRKTAAYTRQLDVAKLTPKQTHHRKSNVV